MDFYRGQPGVVNKRILLRNSALLIFILHQLFFCKLAGTFDNLATHDVFWAQMCNHPAECVFIAHYQKERACAFAFVRIHLGASIHTLEGPLNSV